MKSEYSLEELLSLTIAYSIADAERSHFSQFDDMDEEEINDELELILASVEMIVEGRDCDRE